MIHPKPSRLVTGLLAAGVALGPTLPVFAASTASFRPSANVCWSKKQKIVMLVGAAALVYLYKKHQNAKGEGKNGKYYRSRNGRVYYRDAGGKAHWVTAPRGGISVPANEAQQYQ